MVRAHFIYKLPDHPPQWLCHFAGPPAINESSVVPHHLQHLLLSMFWIVAIRMSCFILCFPTDLMWRFLIRVFIVLTTAVHGALLDQESTAGVRPAGLPVVSHLSELKPR